jgi:hypothetical protein
MAAVTMITGLLPNRDFTTVSMFASALLVLVVIVRELVFALHFFQPPTENVLASGDVATAPTENNKHSLRIPEMRRFADVCFMGVVFTWMSYISVSHSGVPDGVALSPVWPWFAVAWICHVLSGVTRVERTNDMMLFYMTIGTLSVPVRLLKSVRETSSSRYWLHFKFKSGTVNVMNPHYPSTDLSGIKSSLNVDSF